MVEKRAWRAERLSGGGRAAGCTGAIALRRLALTGALIALVVSAGAAALFVVGDQLSAPVYRVVGDPPADLRGHNVSFHGHGGNLVKGWFAPVDGERGAVVLLHALRADRRSMLARARMVRDAGYSVLLIDFQAHGESRGDRLTFGHLESRDAAAAVQFVRTQLPSQPVAVIGVSLGAAAAVLAEPPLGLNAMVLEAMYPTLVEAVENRLELRFGPLARHLAPLLLWQVRPRLGVDPDNLAPIRAVADLRVPLLMIVGGRDGHTTLRQSRMVFERANSPKTLWVLNDVGHEDFHRAAPADYERRVLAFLGRHLGPEPLR